MTYIIGETATYEDKTKELCEALLEDPKLKSAFADIEKFLGDDVAKEAFSSMQEKGQELQAKQQAGIELTAGEVEEFNKLREGVEANESASGFLSAQEEMLHSLVHNLSLEFSAFSQKNAAKTKKTRRNQEEPSFLEKRQQQVYN